MSLFDVIKYPISDLPTREEFKALPEWVYRAIVRSNKTRWTNEWLDIDIHSIRRAFIIIYCDPRPAEYSTNLKDIELMRKIIREHDEHI